MKIGIIGGSGLDNPNLLQEYEEKEIETKFGKPSSKIICGKLGGIDICVLARHGRNHEIPPHRIPYRANIAALKLLGCDYIIATSAVGSLREEIKQGDLIFPDQFIDFTKQRISTFYNEKGEVKHTEMSNPFSQQLRKILFETSKELNFQSHEAGTIVVIEGPRFSTKAESTFFRRTADLIGMTTCPESQLAKEAGIEYASIAMVTDYDCWKQDEIPVTFDMVLQRMKQNAEKVKQLIIDTIPKMANINQEEEDREFIKSKIRTIPNFPKQGVMFRDITTLLKDKDSMARVIEVFYNRYKDKNIDLVAGIESRGFIVGGILANKLGCGFVPIRKKGKLPGETLRQEYKLEYGEDAVEIHKDAILPRQNILLIDDLLATGGTAQASAKLIEGLGGRVAGCGFLIELSDLDGRDKLSKWDVFSLIEFKSN